MKIRIKFSKIGPIKFVGHLDLMRTFQKIFRRAQLPIAYSEGFNPHQVFSIAAPLSVGVTSNGEYIDLKLRKDMKMSDVINLINECCPKGLEVTKAVVLGDKEKAAMAAVSAAKYIIIQNDEVITNDLITEYMKQNEIIIEKKTKKGKLKEINIKTGIVGMYVKERKVILTIATGSKLNIKPEFVFKTLCELGDMEYNKFNFTVHREELYQGDVNLKPLIDE